MTGATSQLRVLVIDDSVDNAEALRALLEVMECATAIAFGGVEGISETERFSPHLVFIDLEMPGLGGCEVAQRLRAIYPKGALRLICLTGRCRPDDKRMCLEAGFDDFFSKPMQQESLAQVVATSNTLSASMQ